MLKKAWLGRSTPWSFNGTKFENPSQKDIPNIYAMSKILLKTSKVEGFSLPLLEAMSAGCVVVCYDMGGNMEFCKDGYNCRIVNRQNASDVIKELLSDDEQMFRLQKGGYKTAEVYSLDNSVKKLIEFFCIS